jgi:hypothetical protein
MGGDRRWVIAPPPSPPSRRRSSVACHRSPAPAADPPPRLADPRRSSFGTNAYAARAASTARRPTGIAVDQPFTTTRAAVEAGKAPTGTRWGDRMRHGRARRSFRVKMPASRDSGAGASGRPGAGPSSGAAPGPSSRAVRGADPRRVARPPAARVPPVAGSRRLRRPAAGLPSPSGRSGVAKPQRRRSPWHRTRRPPSAPRAVSPSAPGGCRPPPAARPRGRSRPAR